MRPPITVLGAGSWGTALAILLAGNGCPTTLWGHNPHHLALLQQSRSNPAYLPGIAFPPALTIEPDLLAAVAQAEDVLLVTPSYTFRNLLEQIAPHGSPHKRIAWATKGFEAGTGKLLHEIASACVGTHCPLAVISGPNFAKEVAAGLPGAVTVASSSATFADDLALRLGNERFRVYTSTDVIGVELGGSLKNIYAIAAGIADGLALGANARAALITRSLAEMVRFGLAFGGQRETFMGLAGVGDLVLTCTDNQSRNRRLGFLLAQNRTLSQARAEIGQTVEGEYAAQAVALLAQKHNLHMPISEQVEQVLHHGKDPRQAVHYLLDRKQKAETI